MSSNDLEADPKSQTSGQTWPQHKSTSVRVTTVAGAVTAPATQGTFLCIHNRTAHWNNTVAKHVRKDVSTHRRDEGPVNTLLPAGLQIINLRWQRHDARQDGVRDLLLGARDARSSPRLTTSRSSWNGCMPPIDVPVNTWNCPATGWRTCETRRYPGKNHTRWTRGSTTQSTGSADIPERTWWW